MNDFEIRYKSWHRLISFFKSGVRILGGVLAISIFHNPMLAIVVLAAAIIAAEVLGIIEELI